MTQPLAFDAETGQALPPEAAGEAVASGRAGFLPGSTVALRDESGKLLNVPSEEAARAIAGGLIYAAPAEVEAYDKAKALRKEADTWGGMAQAGAEGLARGATFGISDQILTGVGVDPEKMEARKEAHPGTALVTEIGGAVAPVLLSGGAGTVGTAARLAPSALLARGTASVGGRVAGRLGGGAMARVAGGLVSGATEGAVYGAGQAISQAALADVELTAEQILAGAGEGALFGGAMGGGAGVLGLLGGKVAGTAKRKLGDINLGTLADDATFLQLTGGGGNARKAATRLGGQDRLRRIGRRLREDGVPLTSSRIDEAIEITARKSDEALEKMRAIAAKVDETGARIQTARLLGKLDEIVAGVENKTLASSRAERLALEADLAPLREQLTREGGTTFGDAWAIKRDLGKATNWNTAKPDATNKALQRIYHEVGDELDKLAESAAKGSRKEWKAASSAVSDYITASGLMKSHATALSQRSLGATAAESMIGGASTVAGSLLGGGSILGTVAGMGVGAVAGAANRYLKTEGGGLIARAADRLARVQERTAHSAGKLVGVKSRIPPPARLAAPIVMPIRERYESIQRDLGKLEDPARLRGRLASLTGELAPTHPDVAAAMQERFIGDAAYLRSQLPASVVDQYATSLTPQLHKEPASRVEVSRFLARYDAINDPTAVLEDIADGVVDMDAVEALKERRPKIYQQMRTKIIAMAAKRSEEIPYKTRVALSLAFDFSADPSLSGAGIAAIQTSYAPPPEKPGPDAQIDQEAAGAPAPGSQTPSQAAIS